MVVFPRPFDNASVGGDASTVPREIELARRSARSYFGKRWFGFALLFLIWNVMGSAFLGQVLVEDLIGQRPRYSVSSRIHDNAVAQAVLHWLWSSLNNCEALYQIEHSLPSEQAHPY